VNTAPQTKTVTIATATALATIVSTGTTQTWDWNPERTKRNDDFTSAIQAKYAVSDSLVGIISSYARSIATRPSILMRLPQRSFRPNCRHIVRFPRLRPKGKWGLEGGSWGVTTARRDARTATVDLNGRIPGGTYHFSGVNIRTMTHRDSRRLRNLDYRSRTTVGSGRRSLYKGKRDFNGCLADNGATNGLGYSFRTDSSRRMRDVLAERPSGLYRNSLDQSKLPGGSSINWKITPGHLALCERNQGFQGRKFLHASRLSYCNSFVPRSPCLRMSGFKASVVDHTVDVRARLSI